MTMLMLFQDGVIAYLPDKTIDFSVEDNISYLDKGGVYTAFFSVLLNQSPYQSNYQSEIINLLNGISLTIEQVNPDIKIIKSGVIFHAETGTRNAKSEISIMSSVSLVGVLLLLLTVFKSTKPFMATIFVIATGAVTSLAVCLLFFDQVYLITLIFGTSLVGISVDYSLHYFS